MSDRPAAPVGPITARRERRGERMVLASFGVTMLTGFAAARRVRARRPDAGRGHPARAVPRRAGRGDRPVGAGADVQRAADRGAARDSAAAEAESQAVAGRAHRRGGLQPPADAPGRAARRARRARRGARHPRPVARARRPAAACSRRRGSRARAWSRFDGLPVPRDGHPARRRASPCSRRASPATPRPRRCSSTPAPTGSSSSRARRPTWAPDGFVAYSKVCTHAGCPVGPLPRGPGRSSSAPATSRRSTSCAAPCRRSGPRPGRCRSCRSSVRPTARSPPWATSRSRSGRRSGTSSSGR